MTFNVPNTFSVNRGPALVERKSVLRNKYYTDLCVQLENDLYGLFMRHRNTEDIDKYMLDCLHKRSDKYLSHNTWKDLGFALLIYGSDILSHYGVWNTEKMGSHLKTIDKRICKAASLHAPYFRAAILQALSYQALLKNKYGKANDYINKALFCIQFLQPCECTFQSLLQQ